MGDCVIAGSTRRFPRRPGRFDELEACFVVVGRAPGRLQCINFQEEPAKEVNWKNPNRREAYPHNIRQQGSMRFVAPARSN